MEKFKGSILHVIYAFATETPKFGHRVLTQFCPFSGARLYYKVLL